MIKGRKKFYSVHMDLLNDFMDLYLSDKNFARNWNREFKSCLLLNNTRHLKSIHGLSTKTIESFKNIQNKFNLCIQIILKNKLILKPPAKLRNVIFRHLLIDLLNSYKNVIDQDNIFTDKRISMVIVFFNYYSRYENYIFSKTQTFEIHVLLKNLIISEKQEKINILKGVELRKIDEHDYISREEYINFFGVRINSALIFKFKTKKFGNIGFSKSKGEINSFQYPKEINLKLSKIITTLRLLKEGSVGISKITVINPSPFSKLVNIPMSTDFIVNDNNEYKLNLSDLNRFKNLYYELDLYINNSSRNKQLGICISRFNKSYIRNDIADQMIDLVIAMESITTTDMKDSLTYKISTQISRMLVNKKKLPDRIKARKDLADKIKDIYEIRSKLVHGRKVKWGNAKNFKDEKEALYESREIVRKAIIKLLKLIKDSNSYKDIFDKIVYS